MNRSDAKNTTVTHQQDKQTLSGSPSRDLIAWMIDVMLADVEIDAHEQELIYGFCKKRQIPKPEVDDMITRAQKQEKAGVLEPQSKDEARAWIKCMVMAGLADGTVTQEELLLIRVAGQKLGFSDFEINRLIFNIRKQMAKPEKEEQSPFFG